MVQAAPTSDYRRWQIKILGATWLAYVGYYFCRMNFYVVKKAFGEALCLDAVGLGHLGTAYLVGYAIGQFSSAFFGRRLGPKRLLLAGTGISICCNVFFGLSQTFWLILVFMAVNGIAQGTGWPGCIGSLGFWFKREQRGSILGVWSTCYQLGPVMAKAFAAWMLAALGYQWSFFGAAMVLAAIWFVVLILHPNTPEDVGLESVHEEEDPPKESGGERTKDLGWSRQVIVSILLMGSIYFCIKFLRYTLFSWAPYFLGMNFGLEGDSAGYLSTVFEAAGFGGVLFAGFASDRLFRGRRASIALIMLAMMMLAFLLMATLGGRILLFFTISMGLCGFMLYGPDSLLSGVGAIDVGSKRGALTAAGIINGMGSVGPIFQEQLVAWMYESSGHDLTPVLILLFGMAVVAVLIMFALWLRARAGKSNL
jgi:OPA family sugar phosphate sensor protein UhpC-like MFS transporter